MAMKRFLALLILLGAAPLGGQTPHRDTTVIIATEYALQVPPTVAAGTHTFLLVNKGKEPHMAEITRIDSKYDAAQVVNLWKQDKPTPFAFDYGGPNLAEPGDTSNATMVLDPGRYVLTCWFVAPDGTLHVMKGMFAQFEVKPVRIERKPPKTNATIVLRDFRIDVTPELRRGFNAFRVENRGPQDHDVQLIRVNRRRPTQEILDWIDAPSSIKGPPPGTYMGGMVGMDKGRVAYFTAHLEPGEYLILCFVPDEKDKKPHFRHGMVNRFRIR